ncbi:MAG: peptidylprolyl isomerase [Sedimentisphaerales bacterium]|nr:peptidylprolyl isomerase [Sedimentisphaerales bacterium]HNY78670.1 peptidylprolyl isomerase [Sedimentisphaerales bacterium]HOC63865.1 peptidylprolyl isomerase [Sedimentisphaerales bacterium]HOH64717.1 peptidylprolyl isomerase [Sedimentisphaerales bacterium]HQA91574.1 peptidylprolyl isomerase [Sedimentisphaerales bacterium]
MNRIAAAFVLCLGGVLMAAEPNEPSSDPHCLIKTNVGDIVVRLYAKEAPKTVENFLGLAEGTKVFVDPKTEHKVRKAYYNGLTFHRVVKGFMIQGGCPLGTGEGGPGYKFEDEINADALGLDKLNVLDEQGRPHPWLGIRSQEDFNNTVLRPLFRVMGITSDEQLAARQEEVNQRVHTMRLKEAYVNLGYKYNAKLKSHAPKRGSLAMANSGPNTNGSQFFINLVDTPWLTGKHTVFGEVVKGMEVVDRIGEVPVTSKHLPVDPVRIISVQRVEPEK